MNPALDKLKHKVISWGLAHPGVRVMINVGSLARQVFPADDWSDLDLELYVEDVESITADDGWLADLGDVWVRLPFERNDHVPEWLILFDGAIKLDLSFHTLDDLRHLTHDLPLKEPFVRGYEVLIDKDERSEYFHAPDYHPAPVPPPTLAEFTQTMNFFWYGVVYIAKQIKRGQLWTAWYRDTTIKSQLLQMIEWHARALHGPQHDTWHDGRFMPQWTDPATWEALKACFPHFEAEDQTASLRAVMALFRRLTAETAARLKYDYSTLLDDRASGFVADLLAQQ
jgi:aminoglycoside 6-adenylyltransferase